MRSLEGLEGEREGGLKTLEDMEGGKTGGGEVRRPAQPARPQRRSHPWEGAERAMVLTHGSQGGLPLG